MYNVSLSFPCVINKYNIFTDVLNKLKEDGSIDKMSPETHKSFMSIPLKCNQCDFEPKTMPQLRQHLLTHVQ